MIRSDQVQQVTPPTVVHKNGKACVHRALGASLSNGGTHRMKQLAAIAVLGLWSWSAQAQTACQGSISQTEILLVNSTTAAGSVVVSNDATKLFVTVTTTGDWTISRLDLAVATSLAGIPQNNGQPNLSQFPYRQTFSPEVTTYTFTVPLGVTVPPATTVVV